MRTRLRFPADTYVSGLSKLIREGWINPWSGAEAADRRRTYIEHLSARQVRYLVITEHCVIADAFATGVPLVNIATARTGWVNGVSPRRFEGCDSIYDPLAESLWDALRYQAMSQLTVTWALLPFHPDPRRPNRPTVTPSLFREYWRWTHQLLKYMRNVHVITTGVTTSEVLDSYGIRHALLLPPRRTGRSLRQQLDACMVEGMPYWDSPLEDCAA